MYQYVINSNDKGIVCNYETSLGLGKGVRRPPSSMNLFNRYLPSAISQLLKYCLDKYNVAMNEERMQLVDHFVGSGFGSVVG